MKRFRILIRKLRHKAKHRKTFFHSKKKLSSIKNESSDQKMTECKECFSCTFDNFELKWWLCCIGSRNHYTLLIKLKNDLKKLQLSKQAIHRGLMQLTKKPYVILDKRLADSYPKKMQLSSQDKDLSQLPHNLQDSVLFQEEKWQNKHQNNDEKKSRSRSSEHNSQKIDEQIEIVSSSVITDANKTCQTKIQKRPSSTVEKSLDNVIQNSAREIEENNSHINNNITLTNDRDIFVERSNIKDSLSKNKLSNKPAYNFVRESENKSLYSKSETISLKNRSINKEHSSSENKLFETSVPIRLNKHHNSNIDSSNNMIFEKKNKQNEKQQEEETKINKESSSSKIKSLDSRIQEHGYESKSKRNVNVSNDTIISNLKTYFKTKVNDTADENQDTSISNIQTSHVDPELLFEQTHTPTTKIFLKIDLYQNGNTKLTNLDNLSVKTDSKIVSKKRTHSESSDESILTKKIQKKEASFDKLHDENFMSDTEFNREVFSEDKRIHDHNESEKQIYRYTWDGISRYMTKKKETYKYLRKKLKRKKNNKIKKLRKKFRYWFRDFSPSKSENEEEHKIILSTECLQKKKLQFVLNNKLSNTYDSFNDITTEKETEDICERDEISIHEHDTSINNSQEDIESVISTKVKSIDSNDSIICIENNKLDDFTTDEEIDEKINSRDKTSIRKRDISVDNSQENIESAIPKKIQCIENYVSLADVETTISKTDTECSENTVYVETEKLKTQNAQENKKNIENINSEEVFYVETKEVNMQDTQENKENIKNVNLADEDVNILKDIRLNLKLSTISTQELISNNEKKDDCNVLQNIKNVALTNNESITNNITDHTSIISLSEKDSSNKKDIVNEVLSLPTNISSKKSDTNDYSSTDDDNINDIEIEIKIKPKSKSRISRKFLLKAPLSSVNTCIKNLNNNPDFLEELSQMNFKTSSDNSRHENTVESTENETKNISDVNQNIETTSNIQEVICNSNHIVKYNANYSSKQQEQSFQDNTIYDKDKNVTQHHQEEKNKHEQSTEQKKIWVTNENDFESVKLARDESDLEKQLPFSNDKEKITDKQKNTQDDEVTSEHIQVEKNKRVQSTEEKETRVTVENSNESAQSARDIFEKKQLSETSLESIERIYRSAKFESSIPMNLNIWNSIPLNSIPINLSMNSDASITSNNAHSGSSTSLARGLLPSYNSAPKPACYSSMTNLPSVPSENITSNLSDDIMKFVNSTVLNICSNFVLCRKIFQEQIFTKEKMYEMKNSIIKIYENIETLKMLLCKTHTYIIKYINQQKLLILPISTAELKKYIILLKNMLIITCAGPFCDAPGCSNKQPSNIDNNSVPNASTSNVRAQFLGNVPGAPLPDTISKIQNFRTQYSTMSHPGPNVNQSQSRNMSNPSHSRQSVHIHSYKVLSTGVSVSNSILNSTINSQSIGKANYVQDRRMPNVNNQQFFANPGNVPYITSSVASVSSINMRTYPPKNQEIINVSSTIGKKYSHIETRTTNNTTALSATNMQQQNQIPYSQMPFYVNSETSYFPINKNRYQTTSAKNDASVTGNIKPRNPYINPQTQIPISVKKSVPQYNNNVPNSFASQSAHAHVQNISSTSSFQQQQNLQQNMHQKLFRDTSVYLTDSSNNFSQNSQPSVPNKRTMPETQIRDCAPNKIPFAKPQQNICQGTPCVYNISQKSSDAFWKVSVSQKPNISQNTMFDAVSPKNKLKLIPKVTSISSPPNKIVSYHFNLNILTEIQKIMLKDQLLFYFKQSCKQQDSKKLNLEKKMLLSFYYYLNNYLDNCLYNYITKSAKENKNHIEKESQNNISLKTSIIPNHQSDFKSSCNNTQSNKNNKNDSICNKIQEKQCLEKNTNWLLKKMLNDPNSKSTMVESDLSTKTQTKEPCFICTTASKSATEKSSSEIIESNLSIKTQTRESCLICTPASKSAVTEKSSSEIIDLRKPKDAPKIRFKKNLLLRLLAEKQSKNIKTSLARHSTILEENPIAETSHRILETKTQDNANINETVRSLAKNSHDEQLSESCSPLVQNTSDLSRIIESDAIKSCSKIAKDDVKRNAKETDIEKMGNKSKTLNVATLNNIRKNDAVSQFSFNTKIQNNKKDNEIVKSSTEDLLSESCLLPAQNKLNLLQDETKDDNVKEPNITETANICKISTILNSTEENERATSQVSCNTETRNKELYHNEACNLNNKIFDKNLQNGTCDNFKENMKKLRSNFTKAQFDVLSQTSAPFISNNTSELLFSTNKNKSAKTSQAYTAHKENIFKTSSEFVLNEQQEDPTNKQANDSGKTCDENSESSGNLHIDENAEKSNLNSQEQCNKVSSFKKDESKARCKSIETLLPLSVKNYKLRLQTKEKNVQKLNEKLSLKEKEMQAEEITLSEIPEDISSTKASSVMQSIDIVKQIEDVKQAQVQMDTHSGVKAINELLRHVSEHKYYRKSTSLCNSVLKNSIINTNVNEAVVDKNDMLNTNVSSVESKDDDNSDIIKLNILNVRSISSLLFEKIDNVNALSQNDIALLNEMREEKSSDVNDNLEVSNSTSLKIEEIKESLKVNNNPEIPNSTLLNEMKIDSSKINDNPEVPHSASLNEMKIEESSEVNDNSEVYNFTSLNEIKIEESLEVNDNPQVPDLVLLNEMKIEELRLGVNDNPKLNSTSLNEIKIEESLEMIDNPQVPDFILLNEMKIEELRSEVNDNPNIPNFKSLNEIKEGKLPDINDNLKVNNFILLNETKEKNMNNSSEIFDSASLNKINEKKSSNMNDNMEPSNDMENKPCLRCKRKSMVYCQACLEAHYCSKRCSDLHWKAIHYKQCKNCYKSIICINL